MTFTRLAALLVMLALTLPAISANPEEKPIETTGWFSDEKCGIARVKNGNIGPSGRECAQRCLKEGARMIFIDEKAKSFVYVANPDAARGQESHYMQVKGTVDSKTNLLTVASAKMISEYRASCAAPRLKE